jgi:hypothetical protein
MSAEQAIGQAATTKAARTIPPPEGVDPCVAALVTDLIGRGLLWGMDLG